MNRTGRRVVAVVADTYDHYQRGITETIGARLHAAGYGTLFLAGRDLLALDALRDRGPRDVVHPLARRLDVRGAIVMTTIIGHGFSKEDVVSFARGVFVGPVVSFGIDLPGLPSVTLDSARALEQLMRHMTRDPARRRFVFLRGHRDDQDTCAREAAFRRALAARDIPIDERLVVDGEYSASIAFSKVNALLDGGARFDAIVSANDTMAASAIAALRAHDLSVPDDVIVSGFDDHPIAIETQPPLTTVRDSVDRQADAAAGLLLEALAAEEAGRAFDSGARVSVEAKLVRRDSSGDGVAAGCVDEPLHAALDAPARRPALRELLIGRLTSIAVPGGVDVPALVDAFLDTLLDGDDRLAATLESTLAHHAVDARRIHWWRHATRQLTIALGRLPDGVAAPSALPAVVRALDVLGGARRASRVTSRLERFAHRELQERLLIRLAGCASHADVWSLLREGLGSLGMTNAWVALHDEGESGEGIRDTRLATARLVFSLSGEAGEVSEPFASEAILPGALGGELERGTRVLCPLETGGVQLGYLLVDPGSSVHLELGAIAASVALALRQVRQRTDLERRADALHDANRALSDVARHDSLTGLPNRARFHENLDAALREARSEGAEIALLFLDLDGFKLINDTLGHGAGDELLRLVAARIAGVLRRGDSLARLGGDEFTVIAAERRGDRAGTRIAEDVLGVVARPFKVGTRVVNVTASIGIARFPADGEDAERLIRNADTAMYHAKASGKSRHAPYTSALSREAAEELELGEAMRRGLETGEFHMHFQPRVDLGDGRLTAFEALMRWRREAADGAEEIGPGRFIPVAERGGLIGRLDAFSLDAACRQASRWASDGQPVPVAVNLSVMRLQEPDIVEQVSDALRRHRLDPTLLELEITESAAMSDVEANIEKLGALRALGVRIAIDDFGTGYSSLSYLRRLPVTSLKVDRSFLSVVGDEEGDESVDSAIVGAVIALGRSLGFRVVAEGVETDAQLAFLIALGCDEGQGYRFGRPLDAERASARLREERAPEVTARRNGRR